MKRKDYQKPMMKTVKLQHKSHILAGSGYETKGKVGITMMDEEEDL